MLECQFHDRSVCEYTVLSTHHVVDQRSRDGKINDARIASALKKIIFSTSVEKRVKVGDQRGPNHIRFLRKRQVFYMIYDHFQATGAYDAAQGLSDLLNICLQKTTFKISIQDGTKFF